MPESLIRKKVMESSLSENDKYYWGYMFDLGRDYIVPDMIKKGFFRSGDSVLEIGCAEAGVLHAFIEKGAVNALGTDISEPRLVTGREICSIAGIDMEYSMHDIIYENPPEEWENKYDFALLRDVIEHLDSTETALTNIRKAIRPGGYLAVTFPPYYSPYGGHQHTVAGKLPSRLPYIHYLPEKMFFGLIQSGRENDIEEVRRLTKIKLTPAKFEKAAEESGYKIVDSDFFFIRPVFRAKFGLPTVKATSLKFIPGIKGFLSLEASYVLQKI
jgi:SAM-dependent methyltransferase